MLEYHVVAGARVYAAMLKNREQIKMLNGQETMAFLAHGEVYINYAKVITANVNGSNGVVHIVDQFVKRTEKKKSEEKKDESIQPFIYLPFLPLFFFSFLFSFSPSQCPGAA